MKNNLSKIVLCNIITIVLSSAVYSQGINSYQENRPPDNQSLAINTQKNDEVREEKAKFFLFGKKKYSQAASFNPDADYVAKVDGKTFVKRNGKFLPVRHERIVGEMKVMREGKIIKKDGSVSFLEEGEAMTMEGYVVEADETAILKERVSVMDEGYNALQESKWEMQDALFMLNLKAMLMDKKMNLVNQKMMLMMEYMDKPHLTYRAIREYRENISLLDTAILDTDSDIREINDLLQGMDEE